MNTWLNMGSNTTLNRTRADDKTSRALNKKAPPFPFLMHGVRHYKTNV